MATANKKEEVAEPTFKFQLLSGKHRDNDDAKTTYVAGDVFEDSRPLDKMFPNKFVNLDAKPEPRQFASSVARGKGKAPTSEKK